MRLLFVGDIFAKPGRRILASVLPRIREREQIDFAIINGENASGGVGLVHKNANDIFNAGADVITGGNHIFKKAEIFEYIDMESRIVRPANFPDYPDLRGRGFHTYDLPGGYKIAVVNMLGTVFMTNVDNPFHCINNILQQLSTPNIFVDFHAEATSEKIAMGWHLDGRVTAMIGTHTHIPTADERILHRGTAYQTDSGMTGPYDSCIGVDKNIILKGFLSQLPIRHSPASGEVSLNGVIIDFDPETGKASAIRRIRETETGPA